MGISYKMGKQVAYMSFAHFNEINEICNGMLMKDAQVVKTKPRKKKRYVIKSKSLTQEQLLEDVEEENEEARRVRNYLYRMLYRKRISNHE